TTYPGTTEEVLLPRFAAAGLTVGHEFFLAFSPERIDPGNRRFGLTNIPKVVGGVTASCMALASALYGLIIERVVPVSSPQAAELVKLFENIFRSVNIALVNELAIMCRRLGLSVWEIIDAAATKPFGFMPFQPGPGIGGHCLPSDPYYLSWRARMMGYEARFIAFADEINRGMPGYTVQLAIDALNDLGRPLKGSRLLVLGVAYKAGVGDVRDSPAVEIIDVFALQMFTPLVWRAVAAFVIFCGLSGAIYLFNDVADVDKDRLHPQKKERPIAAGLLSIRAAVASGLVLSAASLAAAFSLSPVFGLTALGYGVLLTAYSAWLKHLVILDVLTVATGFVLRAVAGAVAVDVEISGWL